MPDETLDPLSHHYARKKHADYAIETYGSELAGDILNCEICDRPYEEHFSSYPVELHPKVSGATPVKPG